MSAKLRTVHIALTPQTAEILEAEVAAGRFANLSEGFWQYLLPFVFCNAFPRLSEWLILTSTNGADWTQRGSVNLSYLSDRISKLGYANGQFVLVGDLPAGIATSPDGVNCVERQSGTLKPSQIHQTP